ncbi:hypothetical protein [Odoribacter laneus]
METERARKGDKSRYFILSPQNRIFKKSTFLVGRTGNRNNIRTAEMIQQQLENLKVLTFEVTDKCNLNCKYCTYGQVYQGHDERQGKNLDFSIARNMLNRIGKSKGFFLILHF